jgi:hypothetical protein
VREKAWGPLVNSCEAQQKLSVIDAQCFGAASLLHLSDNSHQSASRSRCSRDHRFVEFSIHLRLPAFGRHAGHPVDDLLGASRHYLLSCQELVAAKADANNALR